MQINLVGFKDLIDGSRAVSLLTIDLIIESPYSASLEQFWARFSQRPAAYVPPKSSTSGCYTYPKPATKM